MFDFSLLCSLPRPKWSSFFCVLIFCGLTGVYWLAHETLIPQEIEGGALLDFLRDTRGNNPKQPQILVGGSSENGHGFHIEELERRTGMSAAKIMLDGGRPINSLYVLECYPNETRHASMLMLDLAPTMTARPSEYDDVRRKYFNRLRGVESFNIFTDFPPRSSVRNLLRFYGAQLRAYRRMQTNSYHFYEKRGWEGLHVPEMHKQSLRQQAKLVRENREKLLPGDQLPIVKHKITDKCIEDVNQILDLCRSRKIFVVVVVIPQWYGQLNFTQADLNNPTEDPYLSFLQEVNERPDCTVIICRDFEEITSEGTDEDYLMDYGHLTRKGAILYTNWLVDRLLEEPKTAELIRQCQSTP